MGYVFTRDRCEYTVECDSEFINVKSEVDFTELNQNMFDRAEASANSWVGSSSIFGISFTEFTDNFSLDIEVKSIDSIELCSSYLMSLKTSGDMFTENKPYNKYINLYCITFTYADDDYGDTPDCKVYISYAIDNISTDKDDKGL